MTHRCLLYGLVVESDVPLAGLATAPGQAADVRIHFERLPPSIVRADALAHEFYRSPVELDEDPSLVAERRGDMLRLRYADGIRFHIRDDGSEVWCDWDPPLTTADAMTFLLGPVLGLVLRRREVIAVHASAVVHGGRAWAFVGPGGSGKSTIALALARAGFPVLTEDVLALRPAEGGWLAWPAYDHVRLWGESPVLTAGEVDALPTLSPTWAKREVSLAAAGLPRAHGPVALAGWFLLDSSDFDRVGAPLESRVDPLGGAEALRALIENSYMTYLLDDDAKIAELRALGRAAQGVRAHRLLVAPGSAGLGSTVRVIARTVHEASATL